MRVRSLTSDERCKGGGLEMDRDAGLGVGGPETRIVRKLFTL